MPTRVRTRLAASTTTTAKRKRTPVAPSRIVWITPRSAGTEQSSLYHLAAKCGSSSSLRRTDEATAKDIFGYSLCGTCRNTDAKRQMEEYVRANIDMNAVAAVFGDLDEAMEVRIMWHPPGLGQTGKPKQPTQLWTNWDEKKTAAQANKKD